MYKIPAQVIRNILVWGKDHSYKYDTFIKTIRKKDLIKFYSFYKCNNKELENGTKDFIFKQIEKCFNSRRS